MHPARHPSRHPAHRAMGWPLAVLLLCGVGAGCSHSGEGDEVTQKTAQVVAVKGTDLHRVILDPQAVQRLGITTQRVPPRTASSGAEVISFDALFYDDNGRAWVYTNPAPRTYVRHKVLVDQVTGDRVVLRAALPPGTTIVTTGAAELRGAEYGVGAE